MQKTFSLTKQRREKEQQGNREGRFSSDCLCSNFSGACLQWLKVLNKTMPISAIVFCDVPVVLACMQQYQRHLRRSAFVHLVSFLFLPSGVNHYELTTTVQIKNTRSA